MAHSDIAMTETLHHRVTLAGEVLMEDGTPVPSLRVALQRGAGQAAGGPIPNPDEDTSSTLGFHATKADGIFYFMDLAAGPYRVWVRHSRNELGRQVHYTAAAQVAISKKQETGPDTNAPPTNVTLVLKRVEDPQRAAPARRPPR